jgi:hypothetical protein
MHIPLSSRSPAGISADFPVALPCRHCQSDELMKIIGFYPLLYCGKDAVLYQCMKCGCETTGKTAATESPFNGGGI